MCQNEGILKISDCHITIIPVTAPLNHVKMEGFWKTIAPVIAQIPAVSMKED